MGFGIILVQFYKKLEENALFRLIFEVEGELNVDWNLYFTEVSKSDSGERKLSSQALQRSEAIRERINDVFGSS